MEQNKFLLLIDLWRGQTNTTIYNEIFQDEKRWASCNIKVIPLKYSLCQPCDVYFYRQVKDFIKRLQNASILLKEQREIDTQKDATKIIHLLILLSADIFKPMILHAGMQQNYLIINRNF